MIDWHSHILPGLDDGSRDVAESISLINMQMAQGVDTVIATPHFYANDETVNSFLERRKKAFELLKPQLPEGSPKIKLGAEVRYYQGISRMEDLSLLRIEDTKLLLLEMPITVWTEYTVKELIELSGKSNMRIILAHIERYLRLQKRSVWERLYDNGILMQMNTSFVMSLRSKRKAISLLKEGIVQLLGSDCHDTVLRPPQFTKAFEIIQKKIGDDFINVINEYGYSILEKTNN